MARQQIKMDMVQELVRATILSDPSAQQLFVRQIEARLGKRLAIHRLPIERLQLIDIANACERHRTAGMAAMVLAFADLDPDSDQRTELDQLLAEWRVLDTFRGVEIDWLELRGTLRAMTVPDDLRAIYVRAIRPRGQSFPTDCATAMHLFVRLADLNAQPDALPPWVIFLIGLAAHVEDVGVRTVVTNTVMTWAERSGRGGAVVAEWSRSAETALDRPTALNLVVQLDPDGLDDDRYTLSTWVQWYADGWHTEPAPDQVVSKDTMERAVMERVRHMEESWNPDTSARVTPVIEFVLPLELLNHEINYWDTEWDTDWPKPLAMNYPIIVRSLDRMRTTRWHREWHARWSRLDQFPDTCETWVPTGRDPADPGQLEATFMDDKRWVSLVLSEPPLPDGGTGGREMIAALRNGLPVVIWHRQDCGLPRFREVIDELVKDGGLAGLPVRAGQVRRLAFTRNNDQHIARHLTVLWDDPNRQPSMFGSVDGPGRAHSG